jgi:hypothetical protein
MFLCRNYRPGDQIYGFGFSRGAFTIRMLIKLVLAKSLVTDFNSTDDLRHKARKVFRDFQVGQSRDVRLSHIVRSLIYLCLRPFEPTQITTREVPRIAFVGVWDTVDAYGMPVEEFKIAIDRYIWPLALKDRELDSRIDKACHALSIDEARSSFHPLLWDEGGPEENTARHTDQERLTQIWFPGVHANIGGGYPDDGLSNVTLRWMAEAARKKGLSFNARAIDEFNTGSVIFGRMYDSRAGLGAYYRYQPRSLEPPVDEQGATIPSPKFHESVIWRMAAGTDAYAPLNLPAHLRIVLDDRHTASGSADSNTSTSNIRDFAGYQAFIQNQVQPSGAATEAGGIGSLLTARVAAKIPELEKPDQNALDLVWDTVWWRRISYFATLGATLLVPVFPKVSSFFPIRGVFVIFVMFGETSQQIVAALGNVLEYALAQVIGLVQSLLPAAISFRLDAYQAAPWTLIDIAAIVTALLIWGGIIDRRIQDRAPAAWDSDWRAKRAVWLRRSAPWRTVIGLVVAISSAFALVLYVALANLFGPNWGPYSGTPVEPKLVLESTVAALRYWIPIGMFGLLIAAGISSVISGWLLWSQRRTASHEVGGVALWFARRLRTSTVMTQSYNVLTRRIGPVLFAFILIALGLVFLSRFTFSVMDAGGWICPQAKVDLDNKPVEKDKYTFDTNRGCHVLDLDPKPGDSYLISVTFKKPELGMREFAAPLLRRFDQPWFQPIIRAGSGIASTEYVPESSYSDYKREDDDYDKVSWHYKASFTLTYEQVHGNEVIFLNDAVIGLPKIWDAFYRQNVGTFEVTVHKTSED